MSPKNKVIEIISDEEDKFLEEASFKQSVHMFLVVQRMVNQFLKTKNINDKLLINNIIILLNTFGIEKINRIFKVILRENEFGVVKSILIFLNCFCLEDDNTETNRIVNDILADITYRYNLDHI